MSGKRSRAKSPDVAKVCLVSNPNQPPPAYGNQGPDYYYEQDDDDDNGGYEFTEDVDPDVMALIRRLSPRDSEYPVQIRTNRITGHSTLRYKGDGSAHAALLAELGPLPVIIRNRTAPIRWPTNKRALRTLGASILKILLLCWCMFYLTPDSIAMMVLAMWFAMYGCIGNAYSKISQLGLVIAASGAVGIFSPSLPTDIRYALLMQAVVLNGVWGVFDLYRAVNVLFGLISEFQ